MLTLVLRSNPTTTVSDMRKALARQLASIEGDRLIQFDFWAKLKTPSAAEVELTSDIYTEMAKQWGVDRTTARARILADAYSLNLKPIATTITIEDGM